MHAVEIPNPESLKIGDWWSVGCAGLENLANAILGPLPGGWVRRGDNFIRVGAVKYGANARKLDAELAALTTEAGRIVGSGVPEDALRAAAFYHLRFENIHPLCEANGRIGRVILAGQLLQSLRVPIAETLVGLKDWEADYTRLFATNQPPLMFELMLDLLGRIVGMTPSTEAAQLPATIEPLFPQKNVPKNSTRLHPERALANPGLGKQFVQQSRPPQRENPFRKFR